MADFHRLLTISFIDIITIGPVCIRGWAGNAREWVLTKLKPRSKMIQIVEFWIAMMTTCTKRPRYSNIRPRQTCSDSDSNMRSPQPNCSPSLVPFHHSWIYIVSKKPLRPVNISQYRQWTYIASYLVYIAISWSSKTNFCLWANVLGFCSDSHNLIYWDSYQNYWHIR